MFVPRSLHAEALTQLLCQHALHQDHGAAREEKHRRLFREGAQPLSNWSTYDHENGSSEHPVHVSALPRTPTVYRSASSGQASRDTNIPTIPIPPLIIAASWRHIPADQAPRLKATTTSDTKNMLSINWPPLDEVDVTIAVL